MRFIMSQKYFCLGDDYAIKDEGGNDAYYVDGKAFSVVRELSLLAARSGKELAHIRQKVLAWGPTYEIRRKGEVRAIVKKKPLTFWYRRFRIVVPGANDLEVVGSCFQREYIFKRGSTPVATVSRSLSTWLDSYGIEVVASEDPIILLACAVVIDLVCHS